MIFHRVYAWHPLSWHLDMEYQHYGQWSLITDHDVDIPYLESEPPPTPGDQSSDWLVKPPMRQVWCNITMSISLLGVTLTWELSPPDNIWSNNVNCCTPTKLIRIKLNKFKNNCVYKEHIIIYNIILEYWKCIKLEMHISLHRDAYVGPTLQVGKMRKIHIIILELGSYVEMTSEMEFLTFACTLLLFKF